MPDTYIPKSEKGRNIARALRKAGLHIPYHRLLGASVYSLGLQNTTFEDIIIRFLIFEKSNTSITPDIRSKPVEAEHV